MEARACTDESTDTDTLVCLLQPWGSVHGALSGHSTCLPRKLPPCHSLCPRTLSPTCASLSSTPCRRASALAHTATNDTRSPTTTTVACCPPACR